MIVILLAATLLVAKSEATEVTEISSPVGSDVFFDLPSFQSCPNFSLRDPNDTLILIVLNGIPKISEHFKFRTRLSHNVDSMTFTLEKVVYTDEGTYFLEPLISKSPKCQRLYVLALERDFQGTAYWLGWNSWSSCHDVTSCRRGLRQRTRECSKPSSCFHGSGVECEQMTTVCAYYAWSPWSLWSSCSVTCGKGHMRRNRQCVRSEAEDSTLRQCAGHAEVEAVCSRDPCTSAEEKSTTPSFSWTDWGSWSLCSTSCGAGWQTRDRKCVDVYDRDVPGSCGRNSRQNILCSVAECEVNSVGSSVTWTFWGAWSPCSASCGSGWQTRGRKCIDIHSQDAIGCRGDVIHNDTCSNSACTDSQAAATSSGDITVSLPLSGIVGAIAGIFILLLIVVIVVLVVVLRRRMRKPKTSKEGSEPRRQTVKFTKEKKGSIKVFTRKNSEPRLSRASAHIYAEINDFDVYDVDYKKQERGMSIVTIDNPYACMPTSSSPGCSNGHDKGFDFGTSMTYANDPAEPSVDCKAPKRLDSAGYLVPLHMQGPKTKVYTNQ